MDPTLKTKGQKLIQLGMQESYTPYDQPNKPYHKKVGTNKEGDVLFCIEVDNERLINASFKCGSTQIQMSMINTLGKVEQFLNSVEAEYSQL